MVRRAFLKRMAALTSGFFATSALARSAFAQAAARVLAAEPPNGVTSFAVLGDTGFGDERAAALRETLNRAGLKRCILLGDNLYHRDSTLEVAWGQWKREGFDFPVVAIGNHTPGYNAEVQYFQLPREYYTKRMGRNKFVVLNSDDESNVDEQMGWLRTELEAASPSENLFLIYHHPSFTLGEYCHDWRDKEEFQNAIRPLIRDYAHKINAILVGHDHIAAAYTMNTVPLIVCGAGADVRRVTEVSDSLDQITLKTKWIYSEKAVWARLEVDDRTLDSRLSFVEVASGNVVYSQSLNRS